MHGNRPSFEQKSAKPNILVIPALLIQSTNDSIIKPPISRIYHNIRKNI